MRNVEESIIVTNVDLQHLIPVLEQNDTPASEALDAELRRAQVVEWAAVPPDVVTMNTEVVYEDVDTGIRRTVRVVYPRDADSAKGHVSVLAPIGSALLGLRVGQSIEWALPKGRRRVRVVEIRYQPESHGEHKR
jgi:regulator of nucleoside diphosphate kinase